MRKILLGILLSVSASQLFAKELTVEGVSKFLDDFERAIVDNDKTTMEASLGEDFVHILNAPAGESINTYKKTKAEIINTMLSPIQNPIGRERENISLKIYNTGSQAHASYKVSFKVKSNDKFHVVTGSEEMLIELEEGQPVIRKLIINMKAPIANNLKK